MGIETVFLEPPVPLANEAKADAGFFRRIAVTPSIRVELYDEVALGHALRCLEPAYLTIRIRALALAQYH